MSFNYFTKLYLHNSGCNIYELGMENCLRLIAFCVYYLLLDNSDNFVLLFMVFRMISVLEEIRPYFQDSRLITDIQDSLQQSLDQLDWFSASKYVVFVYLFVF